MNFKEFKLLQEEFKKASVPKKIKLYTETEELEEAQYKQLLKDFPIDHLAELERELNKDEF